MKYFLYILLSLFFAGPVHADELTGLWETGSGRYINFKEKARFLLLTAKTLRVFLGSGQRKMH